MNDAPKKPTPKKGLPYIQGKKMPINERTDNKANDKSVEKKKDSHEMNNS